ncbi:unnamed protein product [Rotaria sordida]|uniref:FLYWCH-type domain-containing protein n=1 Tax=Rotaria sordida TaxID=392033 RepID=A0A815P0B9_9BILA|nr:unnamed protein product [Rotaria sordida]CAF1442900.1 unnamed protein product [Rotaria sordida]
MKVKYWTCHSDGCVANVHRDKNDHFIKSNGQHHHIPEPEQIELRNLKGKVKERLKTETSSITKIYEEELARSNLSSTTLTIAFTAAEGKSGLNRVRRKTTPPPIPTSAQSDIPEFYSQTLDGTKFNEQSKAQLSAFYIKAAEEQQDNCKKKYDDDVKKMWSDRLASVDKEKLLLLMIDLINERCKKIGERIQSIYKFQINLKNKLILIFNIDIHESYVQNNGQLANQGQRRQKCHGKRKGQRFRKKYRARDMKPENIEKLLQIKKKIHNNKKNQINSTVRTTTNDNIALTTTTTIVKNVSIGKKDLSAQTKSTTNLNKRKRDISLQQLNLNSTISKSISSISII